MFLNINSKFLDITNVKKQADFALISQIMDIFGRFEGIFHVPQPYQGFEDYH